MFRMRRLLSVPIVCAWIAVALAFAAPARADDPKIPYTQFTLQNGLRVFLIEDHATPQIAVVVWFRVGSKDEAKGKTGFAHLFEHMMFKGSAHVADGKIDFLFEEAGGWTNAWTWFDETVYLDVATSSFLETALYLEADRLAGLTETLDQAKLDNQRDVVRNERRQSYENRPYGMSSILIQEALWPPEFGYHWDTIGKHEDLVAATVDDVKAFFDNYYVPRNATMVIAGDLDPKVTRAWVEKYFGWIPSGGEPVRPKYELPPPITKAIALEATDKVQVPRVFLEWRAPKSFAPDQAALDVAAQILGDGKTSRLYKRLVFDERAAQDVGARMHGFSLAGQFSIDATAKPNVEPEKLLAIIDEELDKLGKHGPTEKELERAKNGIEVGFLHGLEGLLGRAQLLARYAVVAGDPDYLKKDLERYRAVTAKDVQRVVKKYLGKNARVVLTMRPEKN